MQTHTHSLQNELINSVPVENNAHSVGEAIALFDASHHLAVFNQKLTEIWGISGEWFKTSPQITAVFSAVVKQGYWRQTQLQALLTTLEAPQTATLTIEQTNGVYLEVSHSLTSDGGRIFIFRDVTEHQRHTCSLTWELKRQAFLLGLMQRLQPASELREIGEFALSYLIETMAAAFGDVKVITGDSNDAIANIITNQISGEFIATYGTAVAEMQAMLDQGIPYGQGLLWEVVATAKPLFVTDYANHPKAVPAFRHPSIGQLGIFPIPAANGKIIGVLTLESRNAQKLQDAPQQDMLLAACRVLGVAIERAQAQENLRRVNEDLERASQLKSEFLASMSHELRTPLNSILGFSDLILRQTFGALNERQLKYIKVIEDSGQHLLQLINDILDLSKIESGKAELELQPVSIPQLCVQCQEMIQHRIDKKRLKLMLDLDYRLREAYFDERRLRQILINLLSNAVKFTPENGEIKLSCRLTYGTQLQAEIFRPDCSPVNLSTPYVCIEVTDTGIGIPQEKWHLLFRPFQQIDASLTRQHEGTGLGLALTKRLAELHGGTVSLESVVNQGSTFRVWLPLTEMRQQLAQARIDSQVQSTAEFENAGGFRAGNGTIWVVEDQPYNQTLVLEILELHGYAVRLIDDGGTMMAAIQADVESLLLPDLILLDIQLPNVDGLQLIRQLKAADSRWRAVPVVAVTAMAMRGDRDRCLAAGADAYLSKPLNLNNLIETVQSFITSKS